jgi:hypothetical protein
VAVRAFCLECTLADLRFSRQIGWYAKLNDWFALGDPACVRCHHRMALSGGCGLQKLQRCHDQPRKEDPSNVQTSFIHLPSFSRLGAIFFR